MKPDLNEIHQFLSSQGMQGVIIPASNQFPLEQLYIALGLDEKQRDLVLQIKLTKEDLSDEDLKDNDHSSAKDEGYYHLQLLMALPFQTTSNSEADISRLILLINKSLAIPGFGFSEEEKLIYFRSVHLVKDELDELVLMALIGNLIAETENFSETLESSINKPGIKNEN